MIRSGEWMSRVGGGICDMCSRCRFVGFRNTSRGKVYGVLRSPGGEYRGVLSGEVCLGELCWGAFVVTMCKEERKREPCC